MDDILQCLEQRIKQLISGHQQLQLDHYDLHQLKSHLTQENNQWMTKRSQVISQIESLISKLKAIETLS